MRTFMVWTALACVCMASDWPQWRGPSRDCRLEGAAAWPESLDDQSLTRKWRVTLGPSYSGALISGDRIVVTETRDKSHEVVRVLDRKTGKEVWKKEWPGAMSVPFFARENGSWIRSTPATDGKYLYVAGIRDVLVCLELETGEEVWRLDFPAAFKASLPSFGCVCSPLIDGEFIYFQAAGSFFKLDKATGKVIWRTGKEGGGLFGSMSESAFSSPVIATIGGVKQLVVQSRSSLFAVDPETGKALWSTKVEAFRGMNILTPLVIGDTVFTSTYGGGSFLFDVRRSASGFSVSQKWNTKAQGYMSSPVLIGEHVYMHLRNQRFHCVNPGDGSVAWTTRPFGKYWSTVVNGTTMLTLDQRGVLRLINAGPDEYKELSSRKVSEAETWAHLAVADGDIVVRELDGVSVWSWK